MEEWQGIMQAKVAELESALARETAVHAETRRNLQEHRARLRKLALQLCMAESQERRAIASDLHDHVGQALAMIRIRMEEFRGNAVFSGFMEDIDEMVRLLAQTITYTRDLTGTISPPALFELGLVDALDWLAERMKIKRGLRVGYRVTGRPVALADEQKIMVFRSAQELLLNVAKHAETDEATMTLRWHPDRLELEISDKGRGFSDAATDQHADHFGLFSIRERMGQLGGGVDMVTAPGHGTQVTLSLPLDSEKGDGS